MIELANQQAVHVAEGELQEEQTLLLDVVVELRVRATHKSSSFFTIRWIPG